MIGAFSIPLIGCHSEIFVMFVILFQRFCNDYFVFFWLLRKLIISAMTFSRVLIHVEQRVTSIIFSMEILS